MKTEANHHHQQQQQHSPFYGITSSLAISNFIYLPRSLRMNAYEASTDIKVFCNTSFIGQRT